VFNATFNNISVISWRSVLSHNVVSSTSRLSRIRICNMLVVIGTHCIGNYKSNLCMFEILYYLF
jgi:hypothetical protein